MVIIYISCNVSTTETIKSLLDKHKVKSYQIIEQTLAKSPVDVPRLNTPVWPGYNSVFYLQVDAELSQKLLKVLKEYNQNVLNKSELITVCSWKVEKCFFD